MPVGLAPAEGGPRAINAVLKAIDEAADEAAAPQSVNEGSRVRGCNPYGRWVLTALPELLAIFPRPVAAWLVSCLPSSRTALGSPTLTRQRT